MKKQAWIAALCGTGATAILILDAKTALAGAREGILLCTQTVIPSLFPFFVFSILLTSALTGSRIGILKPLCRLFRLPDEAGGILVSGLMGGYPVGAQGVWQAFQSGAISGKTARRMMGFCNNCGPAFLFGMIPGLFDSGWIPWALWMIHIGGALYVSFLIPWVKEPCFPLPEADPLTPVQALNRSLRITAGVCGWVILFRILIRILDRWALWLLPKGVQMGLCGLLELSNGCIGLYEIENPGLRFMLSAVFISFGGICVAMQTLSVTDPTLDRSLYFPGKAVQGLFSLLCAYGLQLAAFPTDKRYVLPFPWVLGILILFLFSGLLLRKRKNSSSVRALLRV